MGFASWYHLIHSNNKSLIVISITRSQMNPDGSAAQCGRFDCALCLLQKRKLSPVFLLEWPFQHAACGKLFIYDCVEAKRLLACPVIVWSSAQVAGWFGICVAFRNRGSLINVSLWKRDAQTWQQRGLSGRHWKWDNMLLYIDVCTWEGNMTAAAERKIKHATACFVKFSPKTVNN